MLPCLASKVAGASYGQVFRRQKQFVCKSGKEVYSIKKNLFFAVMEGKESRERKSNQTKKKTERKERKYR